MIFYYSGNKINHGEKWDKISGFILNANLYVCLTGVVSEQINRRMISHKDNIVILLLRPLFTGTTTTTTTTTTNNKVFPLQARLWPRGWVEL